MDELDLLKKDWQKQGESFPKLSYDDIYKMILKKSSSIVKWIFIISVLEFLFMISLEVVARVNDMYDNYEELGLGSQLNIFLSVIASSILIYFSYQFYKNYKKIKATDSAKVLMENILNTRKTVKRYVFVNLTYMALMLFFVFGYVLFYSPEFIELQAEASKEIPKYAFAIVFFFTIVISIGFIALVYYLLYGFLTRKLKNNYQELKKLEV